MRGQPDLVRTISEHLTRSLRQKDPAAKVYVRRTSVGWLHLQVVTTSFSEQTQDERERQIDEVLASLDLSLGNYPISRYELQTPEEDTLQRSSQPIQLPLWSEILMAPEPDNPASLDEDITKRPFVVTFYSFKGGVGRTTALGLVANLLVGRGRRVVMIDLDLEAPGLSFLTPGLDQYGVLDYIYQRSLTPDLDQPTISQCIRRIDVAGRGELYLISAGDYEEDYIHRLADLDVRLLYQRETNPIHQLLDDVKSYLDPDIILLDARTGFTEMGAIALFDKADLGIICFSPTDQSFAGLQWVVKAATKQRKYRGIPDLRFLLTPMPPVAQSLQQKLIARAADWITENWEVPPSINIDELYYLVPYNPTIAALSGIFGEMPPEILVPYQPVADAINASLRETKPPLVKMGDSRQKILAELEFHAATAQELAAADIPAIFQRTGDFSKFLQDRTWLVRGAKGTGKTLLFRLFVEQAKAARKFAESDADLGAVEFVPGHGPIGLHNTLLNSNSLASFEEQVGQRHWSLFWLNYLLLQLVASEPQLQSLSVLNPQLVQLATHPGPQQSNIVAWLIQQVQSPLAAPQASDELHHIDQWLHQHHKRAWLLYDELDAGFAQEFERRHRAIDGLLGWWVENAPGLTNIIPKILLREDIWANLNFTNRGYFSTRFIQLRWEEDDLWRLVLRQALDRAPSLATIIQQQSGVEREQLDNFGKELLQRALYPLWGERMGREHKAYTHNWVRNRIRDTKNNRFPRSLIQLLQRAIAIEKSATERSQYESVLRPASLINALPYASEQRVTEVRNEYPEIVGLLDRLVNEKSPIGLDRLQTIWGFNDDELKPQVARMVEAGIFQEYPRSSDNEAQRYSVAELYLYGLNMKRQGQR